MRRIAYLLDSFPRLSETFILNEIVELRRSGMEVSIFSRNRPQEDIYHAKAEELRRYTYYFSDNNVSNLQKAFLHLYFLLVSPVRYMKTLLFSYRRRSKETFWYFKHCVTYAVVLRKSKVEHIHSHYAASTATEYAMLTSMLTGIPFTFTAHGWYDIFTYPPLDFHDRVEKSKGVITVSYFNRDHISKRFHIPLDRIHVIRNVVDISLFSSKNTMDKENIILTVARMHPIKGLQYLIYACDILRKKGLEFKCIIVGEGSEREKLEKLIDELKLNSYIDLAGAKTQSKVLEYYRQAKVFALPSLMEGMPMTLVEAMACKVPVVATNICGISELVEDGENGFLVPPKSPEKLAESLELLLTNTTLCQEFGEQDRLKVEKDFNPKVEMRKRLRLWNSF